MRSLLFVILIFAGFGTFAQEGPQLLIPKQDSTEMELERKLEYFRLKNGLPSTDLFMEDLRLPGLNIQQEFYKRYAVNPSITAFSTINSIPEMSFNTASPYWVNGQIFGGSVTQLSDKLSIGGFSYGANSPLSAPLPNANKSYFDTYGSTMFMQYKVSKNFKIETSVSVGHQQGPPGF
ncbi:MAG: hypothetical protein ACK5M7_05130 [Draconibacterium sp.]